MIDFETYLRGPVYAALGVPATLVIDSGGSVEVTILDLTSPVETPQGGSVDLLDFRPGARIRASELARLDIAPADLDGGVLTFRGSSWRILSHQRQPRHGAIYVALTDDGEGG